MSRSIDLLKYRYLKNIEENPELFIGIELEYPVANLEGDATDVEDIKHLFQYLVSCGCSLVVKLQPSKLLSRVRFSSPALNVCSLPSFITWARSSGG